MEMYHARHYGKGGFRLIHGGAVEPEQQELASAQTADGSALTPVGSELSPHPLFDALKPGADTAAGAPVTIGGVSDLETIAADPNISNADFMAARSQRAAEIAGRLGMNDEPAQVIALPRRPDDAS
jgi:hypothetical protein